MLIVVDSRTVCELQQLSVSTTTMLTFVSAGIATSETNRISWGTVDSLAWPSFAQGRSRVVFRLRLVQCGWVGGIRLIFCLGWATWWTSLLPWTNRRHIIFVRRSVTSVSSIGVASLRNLFRPLSGTRQVVSLISGTVTSIRQNS